MVWLWTDDEEFRDWVHPAQLDRGRPVRRTLRETQFVAQQHLHQAMAKLRQAERALTELGFTPDNALSDREVLARAQPVTWDLVRQGESLLLYHKRLAQSDWSYDFLHAHNLDEHWERYAASDRIFREVAELVESAEKLRTGFFRFQEEDERFLDFLDLPDELLVDFVLCRNLFSVGFDEIGVFVAGRGLEGVLRALAKRRKITRPDGSPAADARLQDLIDCFARLRFAGGERVIGHDVRLLLDFARDVRNAAAHPRGRRSRSARQIAEVIANEAQHVWDTCKQSRFARQSRSSKN